MVDIANTIAKRYPTEVELGNDRKFGIRLMVPTDVEAVLTFAKCLDLNDLLFLRINITERSAVERWAHYIETGRTYTVLHSTTTASLAKLVSYTARPVGPVTSAKSECKLFPKPDVMDSRESLLKKLSGSLNKCH